MQEQHCDGGRRPDQLVHPEVGHPHHVRDAHNIDDMKYSASPVVKAAVKVKDTKDLSKLIEG